MFKIKGTKSVIKGEFYLEENDGIIMLKMTDPDGSDWDVCGVEDGGRLILSNSIPPDIGLAVDKDGCIKTVKE